MAKITNVDVYGLAESIFRSSYPMLSQPPSPEEFRRQVKWIDNNIEAFCVAGLNEGLDTPHIKRAIKLARAKGGGHDQFLTGITVTFDLTATNKLWVEAERYTFLNFVSSMSTMHRIAQMDTGNYFNTHVDSRVMDIIKEKQDAYNQEDDAEKKKSLYLDLLYNLPSGFELTAGMITNYRCLKNIIRQRSTHKLEEWKQICRWIRSLPLMKEFLYADVDNSRRYTILEN